MRKQGNDRKFQVEYEKPMVKFIEQFRMRVNGHRDYELEDKIEKKVRKEEKEDEDKYDLENAQIEHQEDEQAQSVEKPKPAIAKVANTKKPQSSIASTMKKINKPTILSFQEDDA